MFDELVEPMREWIQSNITPYPVENDDLIIEKYGKNILIFLKELKNIFYQTDADKLELNYKNYKKQIKKIDKKSKSDFLKKFPEANSEIIKMLQACYIYDNYYK